MVVWRRSRATSIWALLVAGCWWAGTVWWFALYWHRAALVVLVLAAPAFRPRSSAATVAALAVIMVTLCTPIWSNDAPTIAATVVVLIAGVLEARARHSSRWLVPVTLLGLALAGGAWADAIGVEPGLILLGYDIVLIGVLVAVGVVIRVPGRSTLTDLAVDLGAQPVRDVAALTGLIRAEPGLDADLASAIASAQRWETTNARVRLELQSAVRDLTRSRRRLVTVAAEERALLAQELASTTVEELRGLTQRAERVGVAPGLIRALASLEAALAGLRPPGLDHGVATAVRQLPLVAQLSAELALSGERCPDVVEDTLFAVAAEGLANVAKYAAPCQVRVSFEVVNGVATLCVVDDGCGGARIGTGSGLIGLADRVAALGGRFDVASPPRGGTTVSATIPLPSR
jgi:hypothetical protein